MKKQISQEKKSRLLLCIVAICSVIVLGLFFWHYNIQENKVMQTHIEALAQDENTEKVNQHLREMDRELRNSTIGLGLGVLLVFALNYGFASRRYFERAKEVRADYERAQMEDLRYQVILDAMDALYFEWDLESNRVISSTKWKNIMGETPTGETLEAGELVEETEALSLQGMVLMVSGGQEFAEEEYRFKQQDGSYRWCRLRLLGIGDESGETRRIIGIIRDIDDQLSRESHLVDYARRDSLTGVYNKEATREEIETALILSSYRSGSLHGFILLDIDNFKGINDQYGHQVGDEVLVAIANNLQDLFRASDIVGRIGGDEFIILMKEMSSVEDSTVRARDILRQVEEIDLPDGKHPSCSIGVTHFPEDGSDFSTLYRLADRAMYQSKKWGKNCFACYTATMEENGKVCHGDASALGTD